MELTEEQQKELAANKLLIDRYKAEGKLITARPEWMPFELYQLVRKQQNKAVIKHLTKK